MTTPEQYATIEPWLGALPGWVPAADQARIAAYEKYEEIYWSSEEGFEQVMRGDNDNPVFMPTARTLVNTVNRYTATGFNYSITSLLPETPDDEGVAIAELAFKNLFTREQFLSKFSSEKIKGMRKGDWLFHVIADDTKPAGKRIKILTIDPSSYFPVYESDIIEGGDYDKLVKVHVAEVVIINNQENVSRLTYERIFDAQGNQTGIQVSHGIFSMQDWAKNGAATTPKRWIINPKMLPTTIPAIPIYHFKNGDTTERFGSSELRGNESVLLGINQTVSDEDMALALDGIGIYATDGGAPIDAATGQTTDWIMGPGRVLTNAVGLKRLNGVGSVTPYGDHYDRLYNAAKEATGVSDVAIGKVDSATAESGIALMIQLGPILAYTGEKDQHIIDVTSQMFHDLCMWLAEYEKLPLTINGEGGPAPRVLVQPVIGDKIPVNQKQVLDNVALLRSMVPPMISIQTSLKMLRDAGFPIPSDEAKLLAQEALLQAQADAVAFGAVEDDSLENRTDAELAEEEAL